MGDSRSSGPVRMSIPALLTRVLRACCALAVALALLAVLGGGTCSWCSGSLCDDDDDDTDCFDDDDTNDEECDDDDDLFEVAGAGAPVPAADAIARQLALLDGLGWGEHGRAPGRNVAPPPPWLLEPPGYDDPLLAGSVDEQAYRLDVLAIEHATDPRRHPVARVRARGPSLLGLWGLAAWSADDATAFAARVLSANDDLLGVPPWAGRLRPAGTHVLDTIVAVLFEQVPPGIDGQDGLALPEARLVVVLDHLGRVVQIENETLVPPGVVTPAREAWDLR